MKNAKQFIRKGIGMALSIAMTLGMTSMVMAATPAPTVTQGDSKKEAVTVSTIDKDMLGSITVTKYQYNKSTFTPGTATGTTADNGNPNAIDSNKAPLSGVGFTLYQIMDTEETMKYFDGVDNLELKLGDYVTNNGMGLYKDGQGGRALAKTYGKNFITTNPLNPVGAGQVLTDENGQVTFKNLPVGIYVLVETETGEVDNLNTIKTKSMASIISVPMVNTAGTPYEDKTTGTKVENPVTENQKWLYDIHVYPKNETIGATVKIKKKGNADNLAGVTFTLNKYKDDTYAAKKLVDATEFAPVTGKTDKNGELTFDKLQEGYYRLVETDAPKGYIVDQTPIDFYVGHDNTITCHTEFIGLTKYNYNNKAAGNATDPKETKMKAHAAGEKDGNCRTENDTILLEIVNYKPDLTKKVANNGGQDKETPTEAWVDDTQDTIGDTYKYQLTVQVPENFENLKTFKITDTPCLGITDDTTKMTIKVVGGKALQNTVDYTVTPTKANAKNGTGAGFVLTFVNDNAANTADPDRSTIGKIAGKTLTIEYEAYLNKNAEIAGDGNVNTARLDYSGKASNKSGDPQYAITDEAVVYTYQFDLQKYLDKKASGNEAPAGIEFELYRKTGEDNKGNPKKELMTVTKEKKAPTNLYRPIDQTESAATPATVLVTDATGKISVKGLEKGIYYLKEIKTTDGYNLLSDDFEFEIKVTEATKWTESTSFVAPAAGNTTAIMDKQVWASATYKNGTGTDKSLTEISIINKKGFELPKTGSLGYLMFCVIGIVLVCGGAMIMLGGRKKKIR